MAAQDTHENTEEIIDLTELIEKGAVPEADTEASSPAAGQDDDLHTHMRSLNDSGQNVAAEAEIDDLLAQMEYKDEGGADAEATPAAQSSAGDGSAESGMEQTDSDAPVRMPDGHIVDPHEELHMPGIGDVDSLLNSLDIPPQPRPHDNAAPSPEDTDNAVDQMLGSLNGASRPAPEESDKGAGTPPHKDTTDLDDLLAAGTVPEPVISDELESLLREATPSANPPDAKQAQTPAQPAAQAAASPEQNAPTHDLNDDLDALLQSIMVDKPEHSADKDAAKTQDAPQAQPAPASAPDARADVLSTDLDQLLSSGKQADPNQPDPAPTAASGASQPTDADPAKANDKLEFDLDALLAAADAEERDRAKPAPEAPAAEQPGQPSGSLLPDVDLDDILAGNMVTTPSAQPARAVQANLAATPARPDASASTDAAGQATVTADLAEIMARLDQYAEKLQQADDRVQALEAAVAEARAEADQARAEADAAKSAAQQIQSDLDEKHTATQASHESLAQTAAEALHTAQNAAQNVAQAVASATAQQQDQPDSTPSLEALFDTDHPLHQRLMDCINTAAAEAAATAARQAAEKAVAEAQSAMAQAHDAPAGHEDPALLESLLDDRLHAVNLTMRGASARLDAVESRLDELEPHFNDRVEKAAASAAARILREEIGRLLENE